LRRKVNNYDYHKILQGIYGAVWPTGITGRKRYFRKQFQGAIRYKLEKDILIPVEIVEFSQIKGTQDDCEIAKSQGDAKFTVIGKAKCSVLGTNFDPYFK